MAQQDRDLVTVAKGGGISLVGTAIARLVNYVYSLVLVWGLGGEKFGLYTLALAIVSFVGVVAELGLGLSIVRFGAIEEQDGESSVHRVTLTAVLISIPVTVAAFAALQLGATLIAASFFGKPEMTTLLRLLAWSVPLMVMESLFSAATKALKLVQYAAIVTSTQAVSSLLLAMAFMFLKLDLRAIVVSFVFSHALSAALALIFYLRVVPRSSGLRLYPIKEMMRFSLPLTFMKWIQFANERTEVIFLGFLPSTIYVGVYRIAWSLAGLETMLRLSLEEILAPFSSRLSHRQEIEQLDSLYKTTAKWSFTGALLLASIYVLLGKTIMEIFDPGFAIGVSVLIALGLAQLFNEATGACGTILIMSGRSDLSLLNTVVLFVSSVALDWLLIPRFGLSGAAVAGAATIVLINILRVAQVWTILGIHPFTRSFLKPVVASLAGIGFVWLIRWFLNPGTLTANLLDGLIFVCVYLVVILLLRLDEDDLVILNALQSKLDRFRPHAQGAA